MTILTIFLGIIVVLLILLVISYLLNLRSTSGILDLKTSVPPITTDSISKPTSPNYYYSTWVYVNTWDTNVKTLFTYGSQSLTLAQNSPDLTFNYNVTETSGSTARSTIITNAFPIQKWCHVAISKNNSVLDFYLDGKLIKSYQPTTSVDLPTSSSSGASITFGSSGTKNDIFLAKFQRSPTSLDPKSVWNLYLSGPGTGVPMGSDYNYNLALTVTKDSIVQKTYKLY